MVVAVVPISKLLFHFRLRFEKKKDVRKKERKVKQYKANAKYDN